MLKESCGNNCERACVSNLTPHAKILKSETTSDSKTTFQLFFGIRAEPARRINFGHFREWRKVNYFLYPTNMFVIFYNS